MEINIDQTRWWQRVCAAFIFFTRLPFWRLYKPPRQCYDSVVEHWPLVGWLTGGMMAAILYFGGNVAPWPIVVIVAIISRVLLTGALHEDGLADFMDGFGGGGNYSKRILEIMKDSHIGTYGVLALILYFATFYLCIESLTPTAAALTVMAGDAYCKMLAAQIVMFLPYARTEETAKNKTIYRKMSIKAGIILFFEGVLPMIPLFWITGIETALIFVPCIVMYFLFYLMNRKIQGYTGDCCGALFLLTELSFYLTMTIL